MGKRLIALYPILYCARQYAVGDELPAGDSDMVKAWLEAKTAEWRNEDESAHDAELPDAGRPEVTASPATAIPGIEGMSGDGANGDLIGRVPNTTGRQKVGRNIGRNATRTTAEKKK